MNGELVSYRGRSTKWDQGITGMTSTDFTWGDALHCSRHIHQQVKTFVLQGFGLMFRVYGLG